MRINPATIRIPLPSVQQAKSYDCGPAVLLSILAYYGVTDISRDKAAKRLKTNRAGTTAESIASFARGCGLRATIKCHVSESLLDGIINAGRPIVCAVQAHGDGHWVVPVGSDKSNIYFADPMNDGVYGYRSRAEFMSKWWDKEKGERVERLGVVIYKQSPPYMVKTVRVK